MREGAGSVWEKGKEKREGGKQVPQDCRKLEKWGKLKLCDLFQSKKGKEAGVNEILKGIGIQRYGKQAPTTSLRQVPYPQC